MTDKEIIKALECCSSGEAMICEECPLNEECYNDELDLAELALDIINRQQAEIGRLQKEVNLVSIQFQDLQEETDEIRAKAYKEFADKLKNEINIRTTYSREQDKNVMRMIDNFVKEMVGDTE